MSASHRYRLTVEPRPGDWIRFRQDGRSRLRAVLRVKGETVQTAGGWVPLDQIIELRRRGPHTPQERP